MIKGVIIEDEHNARETLRILIDENCPDVKVVGEGHDVKSGLECIVKSNPDLVFLDIEMPDGDGFDLLRQLKEFNFDIIFTTAYSEFAVKAFKYNTIDYLLKPIVQEELIKAVEKAQEELKSRDLTEKFHNLLAYLSNGKNQKRIVLSSSERYDVVSISEIIMCKSDKNYTSFYLEDGQVIRVAKTMKEFTKTLVDNDFIKPHRGYLINLDHVKSFGRSNSNTIRLTGNHEVPVSTRNKDRLLEVIHKL